jgi:hypothetical protein
MCHCHQIQLLYKEAKEGTEEPEGGGGHQGLVEEGLVEEGQVGELAVLVQVAHGQIVLAGEDNLILEVVML